LLYFVVAMLFHNSGGASLILREQLGNKAILTGISTCHQKLLVTRRSYCYPLIAKKSVEVVMHDAFQSAEPGYPYFRRARLKAY